MAGEFRRPRRQCRSVLRLEPTVMLLDHLRRVLDLVAGLRRRDYPQGEDNTGRTRLNETYAMSADNLGIYANFTDKSLAVVMIM